MVAGRLLPVVLSILLVTLVVSDARATNGMNMEAYGPIAAGMGAHRAPSRTARQRR